MVELLEQVNHWHWLAFGLALLRRFGVCLRGFESA